MVPGAKTVVATTPPAGVPATVDGWRSVPVLRKTPFTLANTLTIPFLSLSAFGEGPAGWAEELMMLLVGVPVTAVGCLSGQTPWKKGFVRNPTGW